MATLTLTDEQIQRDVLDELKWDMRVRPNEVGVSVKDGIVTLTGWFDSYAKKLAAEAAAHRVHSVKAVVNDIEVRLPSSVERTDPDLAQAVLTSALDVLGCEAPVLRNPRGTGPDLYPGIRSV